MFALHPTPPPPQVLLSSSPFAAPRAKAAANVPQSRGAKLLHSVVPGRQQAAATATAQRGSKGGARGARVSAASDDDGDDDSGDEVLWPRKRRRANVRTTLLSDSDQEGEGDSDGDLGMRHVLARRSRLRASARAAAVDTLSSSDDDSVGGGGGKAARARREGAGSAGGPAVESHGRPRERLVLEFSDSRFGGAASDDGLQESVGEGRACGASEQGDDDVEYDSDGLPLSPLRYNGLWLHVLCMCCV